MAFINGTAAADTLTGTADPDTINGLAGDDTINGGAGVDLVQGGAGADLIDGGAGADTLIGGADSDTYLVDDQGDQVIEGDGEGAADTVLASVSYVLGSGQQIETLQAIGSAAINLTGNELAQTLRGNNAANTLDGGVDAAADVLIGGLGDDTYLVRSADDSVNENAGQGNDRVFSVGTFALAAGQEIEFLSAADQGGSAAVNLTGNEFAQVIAGNQGANVLTGGITGTAGADTLIGLGGNDTYQIVGTAQVVTEAAGQGNDTVLIGYGTIAAAAGTYNFSTADVETINASASTGLAINIIGSGINQTITGTTGNNVLNGGGGTDALNGGDGDDTYVVDGGDTITDSAGADTVITSAPITLGGAAIERVFASGSVRFQANGTATPGFGVTSYAFDTVDGSRNLNAENTSTAGVAFLNGNATAQTITGDAGANILDGNRNAGLAAGAAGNTGAAFADTLSGLAGDDIYRVYEQNDVVLEDRDGGRDTIFTSASYSLATNDANAVAALAAQIPGAQPGDFFTVAQVEVLSTANNSGTDAIDLTGNAYGQVIVGNFGVNNISGGGTGAGGGTDVLIGLSGNDVYTVGSVNSVVFEDAGQGDADVVNVTVSGFTLNTGTQVETLNFTGTGNGAIVGNERAQAINGGAGNDTLSGGGGADTLAGGAGDDTYRVSDLSAVINETAGAGNDSVFTTGLSYNLAAGASIEYLSTVAQASTENISLVGNQLAQTIVGNFGDNVLDSDQGEITGQGATQNQTGDLTVGDTLIGLAGNDTYRVYSQNDVVVETAGQGTDTVLTSASYNLSRSGFVAASGTTPAQTPGTTTSVEVLSAASQTGTTAGLVLVGNNIANTVVGNDAGNTINGSLGNDTLIGRGGSDTFAFTTALGANNVDTLSDFAPGDLIGLADSVFAAATDGGAITADEFFVEGSGTQTADQVLIYNQATGQLFYDADGSGTGSQRVLFAQFAAGTGLGFNDFVVYNPTGNDLPLV